MLSWHVSYMLVEHCILQWRKYVRIHVLHYGHLLPMWISLRLPKFQFSVSSASMLDVSPFVGLSCDSCHYFYLNRASASRAVVTYKHPHTGRWWHPLFVDARVGDVNVFIWESYDLTADNGFHSGVYVIFPMIRSCIRSGTCWHIAQSIKLVTFCTSLSFRVARFWVFTETRDDPFTFSDERPTSCDFRTLSLGCVFTASTIFRYPFFFYFHQICSCSQCWWILSPVPWLPGEPFMELRQIQMSLLVRWSTAWSVQACHDRACHISLALFWECDRSDISYHSIHTYHQSHYSTCIA